MVRIEIFVLVCKFGNVTLAIRGDPFITFAERGRGEGTQKQT